LQLVPSMN